MKMKLLSILLILVVGFATAADWPPPGQQPTPAPVCGAYDPLVAEMLASTTAARWQDWIEKLSGAEPVWVGGRLFTIQTRYSQAMFSGRDNARAFDFVLQMARHWVNKEQIEVDEFSVGSGYPVWKNLVITFPGRERPDEVVILSAHLDSKSINKPFTEAPGADDNATGSSALLEAVRLFRNYSFSRTIKVIFFTGEEWGMLGSKAYVADHDTAGVVGVINLDMLGYDGNNDRCFEIHVGQLAASNDVGNCVAHAIQSYNLNLTYDYLTDDARTFSDHSSFWNANVGAVLLMENMFRNNQPTGCTGIDPNPGYHATRDTLKDNVTVSYGFDVARAGLACGGRSGAPAG